MKILTRLYLVVLMALCTTSAWAQGKFSPGYAVKSNGDTLRGFIRDEGWERSPTFFEFKNAIGDVQAEKLETSNIRSFKLDGGDSYKNKRIGVLDIHPRQTYTAAPSLVAKDSVSVFLRSVYQSSRVELFEYGNPNLEAHYFVSKNGAAPVELFNYPFNRVTGDKKYALVYDEYKKQLPALFPEAGDLGTPAYNLKALRKYFTEYDESFGEKKAEVAHDDYSSVLVDVHFFAGTEGWKEPGMALKTSLTYGLGARIMLPRKFNNRYIRLAYSITPGVSTADTYGYSPDEKISFKTITIGAGTYVGTEKARVNFGLDYSGPLNTWRSALLGPHVGLNYKRVLGIEVTNFANIGSLILDAPFFNAPRITVNYFLNINKFKKKK